MDAAFDVVALAASAGGLTALGTVLAEHGAECGDRKSTRLNSSH